MKSCSYFNNSVRRRQMLFVCDYTISSRRFVCLDRHERFSVSTSFFTSFSTLSSYKLRAHYPTGNRIAFVRKQQINLASRSRNCFSCATKNLDKLSPASVTICLQTLESEKVCHNISRCWKFIIEISFSFSTMCRKRRDGKTSGLLSSRRLLASTQRRNVSAFLRFFDCEQHIYYHRNWVDSSIRLDTTFQRCEFREIISHWDTQIILTKQFLLIIFASRENDFEDDNLSFSNF